MSAAPKFYRCAGPSCPGLLWPAHVMPHPVTCAAPAQTSRDTPEPRSTILPVPPALPLWERYEQAARAVDAYVTERRRVSVAVLGVGSPARLLNGLDITRANAAQALHDLSGDFRLPFPLAARLVVWSKQMRDCETTTLGDEEEADNLRALGAACAPRDTVEVDARQRAEEERGQDDGSETRGDGTMNLHGWYKPRFGFMLDGRPWTTDGFIAVAVDALPDGIDMHKTAHEVIGLSAKNATSGPIHRTATTLSGHAVFGERAFQAHYIDLCEAAHPGLVWRTSGAALDPVVGFVDGRPVAVVMGMRIDGQDPAGWTPVYPKCPACDGEGGPECTKCDGTGEAECPHCGNETECEECDGEGHTDGCPDCGGTGRWTAPQAA